jgi:phosphoglycerate kinase
MTTASQTKIKTIRDIDVAGKRVFVRVDFNVPQDKKTGKITDDTRIVGALPTIKYLQEKGAKVVLASHMGRPKAGPEAKYSLKAVAELLAQKLGKGVAFVEDCVGDRAEAAVAQLKNGDLLMLENVRFYKEEEANDSAFCQKLARLADVYVNDAFGTAHRAHATTAGVAAFIKGPKVSGFLIEKELEYLGSKLDNPVAPFVVIMGGAKVSDKITVLARLMEKANTILIGGGMAYTFALAQGKTVGKSLCEPDKVPLAKEIIAKAQAKGVELLFPIDTLITDKLDFDGKAVGATQISEGNIPEGWEGVDIGPKTVTLYREKIAKAKTILWNGPMGVFEIKPCDAGTRAIATAVADNKGATSIIGGGDSVTAINQAGLGDKVTFMSTGGGASLEFLEGKVLPGVAVLERL